MLKAIAIDDEPIALDVIECLVSKVPFVELAGSFFSCLDATEFIRSDKIDLIFLDIRMPDLSGIDFVKSLVNPPMIIFTTAHSEHGAQSFELEVIDYLLKPFSLARFLKACNRARDLYDLRNRTIETASEEEAPVFIKSGYQHIRIRLDSILYAESTGNYVQFVLEKETILSRLTMNEAEEILNKSSFIRIHRSYIVAKRRISRIEKKSVWLGHIELPVGLSYTREIERLIKTERNKD